MLDRNAITGRIPHQGDMCLLDSVAHWDASTITCTASSHRHADNPLRWEDSLGVAAGIEYAAQAMALHGALRADDSGPPTQGYLASVRSVRFHASRLDTLPDVLHIEAEHLSGNAGQVLYRFVVSCAGQVLLDGRAAVILDAGEPE